MPITRIPPTGQREIEFATGNLFKGLNLARQFGSLQLQQEEAKRAAIQRELENRIAQAQEKRALTLHGQQQTALTELGRRTPPPGGQLFPPLQPGPPNLQESFSLPVLRKQAGVGAAVPVPVKKDKKLTPIQMLTKSVNLWDKDRPLAIKLGNEALKQSGSTFRFEASTTSQVGRGMADLMIDYNTATEKIDFNLPVNAPVLDKIESGLLEGLTKSEAFQRATPDNQTKMANAAGKFFEAKRKMRQESRTVREEILRKVLDGKPLKPGEKRVYDETIKRKDPLTPTEIGERQEARTTARLKAYRRERLKAITTNNLDDLRSLITDAEEKLLGRADPAEVERLMWDTLEAHYSTKRRQEISPDELSQMRGELQFKFGYDQETAIRLLRLQFEVIQ